MQLAVFGKNKLQDPLDLNVFSWQELVQFQEANLEPSILYLTLQGCQLYGILTRARASPINDGITRLEGKKRGVLVGENERLG